MLKLNSYCINLQNIIINPFFFHQKDSFLFLRQFFVAHNNKNGIAATNIAITAASGRTKPGAET